MINPKIYLIRKKLDKIDDKLLVLIKKRLSLVKIVLKNKQFKSQIIDNKRIKAILRRIKKLSIKKKIDTKITYKIWRSMIKAFIDYEFLNFKKK